MIAPMNDDDNEETRDYVRNIELYQIIHDAHIATDPRVRNRIMHAINSEYENVTAERVNIYLKLCKPCQNSYIVIHRTAAITICNQNYLFC